MIYKSEDIKKMNSITLLKELYQHSHATMSELVENTNFSQSLVRSILKDLETKEILHVKNIDQSSGGRCPSRYTFNKDYFQILSVFINEGIVLFIVKDIFNSILYQDQKKYDTDEELEKMIVDITKKYTVNCISIGSSGVVQEDCFYNDHGEYMEKHDFPVHLKEILPIPILVENDVKCMMMGVQSLKQYDNLAYLYMSQTGIGSAYYLHDHIVKGNQSFAGELGLLPYYGKSINQTIASNPSLETLEDLYAQLIITIAVTIDPKHIMISGKQMHLLSIPNIKSKVQQYLSKRYQLHIDLSEDPMLDALHGLHYLGISKLFDLYTNYERRSRNG